jgi:coenzyme F420 hydrogenase subunit beta
VSNNKTIESAVRDGLCTGCGTCVGVCPHNAVEMVIDAHRGIYIPHLDEERCNECGLCFQVCPGHAVDFKQLNLDIFGREPEDILIGNYLNCYIGHATDYDIRYNSASGGLVTALLIFALEEKLIDGALVTKMREDRPLEPQPFIARTREEIISASKSKYCPVPANIALKEILKSKDGERFAVVGLPCHIHGIRKAEVVNKKLKERITLHLGIFCANSDSFLETDFLLQKYHIERGDVAQLNYRGSGWPGCMTIRTKDGASKSVPYNEYIMWHSHWFFTPRRCTFCSDGLAELADISLGDAWLPEMKNDEVGQSIIISRHEKAERILRDVVLKRVANVEKISAKRVAQSQIGLLYSKKKGLSARISLFHKNATRPDYSLISDMIDYVCAIYQNANASLISSHPFLQKILKHIPLKIVRLYSAPSFIISRVQMKRVIGHHYGGPRN